MSELKDIRTQVVDLIQGKLTIKRHVYEQTKEVFALLKEVLEEIKVDLQKQTESDRPIMIETQEIGQYEVRLRVGGDTLVFLMHSNVFDFEGSHYIHKSGYVRNESFSSMCGQIYMYNFLTDSFKYSRVNDYGYLIARLFVNKDMHYFVEGKQKLSFLFNDFKQAVLDRAALIKVVDAVLLECLQFDLFSPPYKQVEVVTVDEINQVSNDLRLRTGKRLGFRFSSDESPK